jgi:hypothetical protein
MKKIFFYISSIFVGSFAVMVAISVYLFYAVEPGNNDCMRTYVKNIKTNTNLTWYYYKTPWNSYHIDIKEFKEYEKLWIVKGCNIDLLDNKYIIEGTFNTIYCYTTLILD